MIANRSALNVRTCETPPRRALTAVVELTARQREWLVMPTTNLAWATLLSVLAESSEVEGRKAIEMSHLKNLWASIPKPG